MRRTRRFMTSLGVLATAVSLAAFTQVAPASAAAANIPSGHNGGGGSSSYNGLALTPPMGFNDWYQYRCGITEDIMLETARSLVSNGLAKLGYNYVNLDDCWMATTRSSDGELQADPTRFPHGIKWLADQIHAMGLKLGIYESIGTVTCQKLPGSYGHYQQDADTFASWGIDLLKFDYCGVASGTDPSADYEEMSQALLATGRPIVYSGEAPIAAHNANPSDPKYLPLISLSSKISNMWRVAPDLTTDFNATVFGHLQEDLPLADYAHPGAWNDLDMLAIGNPKFDWTVAEQQVQMSIWAELASPLLVSTDLTNMSAATKQILSNKDVIAVDQDRLGEQGRLITQDGPVSIVSKPLANGDVAVLLVNTSSAAQQVTTTASAAGLPHAAAYAVRDLWAHTTRESAGVIATTVPPEGATLYRVSPLHGQVGWYPPLTDLATTPDVPPAYPGSQFQITQPGQTITVPTVFRNDGRQAVTHASLSLSAPSGWKVSGTPARAGAVPGGGRLSGSFQVTVPPGTAAGSYTLTGGARYRWSGIHTGGETSQASLQVTVPPTGTPYLDQLTWLSQASSFHDVLIDKSYFGGPLTIHGTVYPHGLWANSIATIYYHLGANCSRFTTDLGLDDSVMGTGAVDYQFFADGKKIYDSGVVTNSTPTVYADVDVSGAHILELYVAEGNGTIQYGNADFGNPQLTCSG
ncbi:NPCBM/NEW2 domain-containing protein [Actinoallomurus acaciae]|uniref:Alpha-galactosidase n=1 Tax=Actinoallomurus acaciae TaxID=502577 RepID=A0ABV5YD91_9ACTN